MTKTESRIIRNMLTTGQVLTFNAKGFKKAEEVLNEVMQHCYVVEDESERYGVDYCWVFYSRERAARKKRNKS